MDKINWFNHEKIAGTFLIFLAGQQQLFLMPTITQNKCVNSCQRQQIDHYVPFGSVYLHPKAPRIIDACPCGTFTRMILLAKRNRFYSSLKSFKGHLQNEN
jgi:hypothetical protein